MRIHNNKNKKAKERLNVHDLVNAADVVMDEEAKKYEEDSEKNNN